MFKFQIFEKALDEPKYSSMYAQLCKFLVEKAPNFEPPDSIACTFKKLLLKKCRDEFENRSQISQEYEKMANNGGLNTDEEDAKYLAKRKMLGNIKFMGELVRIFSSKSISRIFYKFSNKNKNTVCNLIVFRANSKLFKIPSSIVAVNNSWSAEKNNLFPTRRKTWNVCVTS